MIVGKAVKMAEMMKIPVLGLVENMAWFECPDCHKRHYIFGKTDVQALAERFGIETYAELPINPDTAELCDIGAAEKINPAGVQPITEKIISKTGAK